MIPWQEIPGPVASFTLLTVTLLVILLLGRFGKDRLTRPVTIVGILAALLSLPLFREQAVLANVLTIDLLSVYFSLIFLSISLVVVLYGTQKHPAYHASVLLSTMGMLLAASVNDILMLYVAIELVTVPTYALVMFKKTRERMEAGVKYFVVSIVASAFLLLGTVLLAINAGTTRIPDLLFHADGGLLIGVAALIAGLGFKLGIWPFSIWIPDVYQGSGAEVAGLLAGASKKAAYAALLRVVLVLGIAGWSLAILALVAMTIPNLVALRQDNAKRLLAYSIMTHAGYLMMGVAVMGRAGFAGTIFHGFTHAFMATGAFLVLGVFASNGLDGVEQLRGLGRRNPLLGAALTIFLLSLAGIPLLAGFASKLFLFLVTYSAGFAWLVVAAVVNSAIALYYYFRIIRSLYGYKSSGKPIKVRYGALVAILICLFATIFIGIYPGPMIDFAMRAVEVLPW